MVIVSPNEPIEVAFKRLYREMLYNGVIAEIEKNRFYVGKGQILREKRRKIYKTKKRRARLRRLLQHKKA